jgi:hypothetical protein
MQNRYVGDIGDFAKFALLRALCQTQEVKLGVVWYLYGDETHNSDGRHVTYLQRADLRHLDPKLFDCLHRIVKTEQRSVRAVQRSRILGKQTTFYDASLVLEAGRGVARERVALRDGWLRNAIARTAKCDVVFLDPDNGLEITSVPRHAPKAGKYVYWEELLAFWEGGQSLVVYNHLHRRSSANDQTQELMKKFVAKFPDAAFVTALLFRRGSCRHFWIVAQPSHARRLTSSLRTLLSSQWSMFFETYHGARAPDFSSIGK